MCPSRQRARLLGGEVIFPCCRFHMILKKGRFDKEQICMIGQFKNSGAIFPIMDRVGNVTDPQAGTHLYDMFQCAQGKPPFPDIAQLISGPDPYRRLVGVAVYEMFFQGHQPDACGQAHFLQNRRQDVEPLALLEAKGKAGNDVVEKGASHGEETCLQEDAVKSTAFLKGLRLESRPAAIALRGQGMRMDLRRDDRKIVRVVFHEIPSVGRQFVLQVLEKPRRAV